VTTAVEFDVVGTPAPQGNKTAFMSKAGRAIMTESRNVRAGHERWRSDVALAALAQVEQLGLTAPLDGALQLDVTFRFRMPASRSKADRERGHVFKRTAPDLDKLMRSIGDSLTAGGLIADDARIAVATISKHEVLDWTGARIAVRVLS
jgi:crossover junction endodeoxyribonuclease RusA